MTDKETVEGNKLIAEFMGVEQMFDHKTSPPEPLPIYWIGYQIHESELDYDSDWSRLMPVVEKIEQYRLSFPEQANAVCDCKIVVYQKVLWREIVNFIKFFNAQQK